MSLEITGKLLVKYDPVQVNDKFKKREFVLELAEEINGNIYTNYAKMQLVQTKCEIIDRFKEGDMVKVSFNIKGNRWERDGKVNYITNLDAWRVESPNAPTGNAPAGQGTPAYNQAPSYNNQGGGSPANYNQGGNSTNFNQAPNYNPSQETVDDLPF